MTVLKLTKQVCTIGPKSESKEMMTKLVKAGMNVIRLNFSHGDFAEHGNRIETIREINKELGTNVAILLDTKGPEIRTNLFANGGVDLVKGATVSIMMDEVLGTSEKFSVTHETLTEDVEVGGTILLDDGYVELTILEIKDREIVCLIENNAFVKDRRGVNVPGAILSMPFLSEKDKNDIIWGVQNGVDYVATSFTRRPEDVIQIRELLNAHGGETIQIIPKVENQESVDKIEALLEVSDGIMVARGDLGVEVAAEEVPVIQKRIIRLCIKHGKPVITATQMLESMQKNPRPTRAEVSDVANAVFDGSDAVMLSGESAAGDYPEQSVRIQAEITVRAQSEISYKRLTTYAADAMQGTVSGTIGYAVIEATSKLESKAIIALTRSGATARTISKFRPSVPVIALVPNAEVARSLALNWAVFPIIADLNLSMEDLIIRAAEVAKTMCGLEEGENIIITAGIPKGSGTTNLMHIHTVE
ncbi:pyruvate kinase [Erysipelotrichaceae bacterium]|nr:pyruvate kinase [Erysipelotrichaceae bacterium]